MRQRNACHSLREEVPGAPGRHLHVSVPGLWPLRLQQEERVGSDADSHR